MRRVDDLDTAHGILVTSLSLGGLATLFLVKVKRSPQEPYPSLLPSLPPSLIPTYGVAVTGLKDLLSYFGRGKLHEAVAGRKA